MKKRLTICLDLDVVDKIDKARGRISVSAFINDIFSERFDLVRNERRSKK